MRRKIGAIFGVLVIVFAFSSGYAKAEDAGPATFSEGHDVASAVNGENYLLSTDDSGGTVLTLTGSLSLRDHIELTGGELTVDLAGGSISRDGGSPALRVTGGTVKIVNTGDEARYISAVDQVVEVDGGIFIFGGESQQITARKSSASRSTAPTTMTVTAGEARILSGTVTSTRSEAVAVSGGRLELSGGQVISGTSFCVDLSGGLVQITGGELRGRGGVSVRGGMLEVTGGSIEATGTGQLTLGGADYGLPAAAITAEKYGSVTVTGGARIAGPEGGRAVCFAEDGETSEPNAANFNITGGVFSHDVNEFLKEGWACVESSDGWLVDVAPESAEAKITGDGERFFATLAEAVEAARELYSVTEVELLHDASGPGLELGAQGELVIDLCGHSYSSNDGLLIPENATVTVKNGALAGSGGIESRGDLTLYGVALSGELHSTNGHVEVINSSLFGGVMAGYVPASGAGTQIYMDDASFQTVERATVYSQYSGHFMSEYSGQMAAFISAGGVKYGVLADGTERKIEFVRDGDRLAPLLPDAAVSYVSDVAWVEFNKALPDGTALSFELSGGGQSWAAQKSDSPDGFSLSFLNNDRPGRWPAGVYTVRCYVLPGVSDGEPVAKYFAWEKAFSVSPKVQPASPEIYLGDGVPAYQRQAAMAAASKTTLDESSMDLLAALAAEALPTPTQSELEALGSNATVLAQAFLNVEVESYGADWITYNISPIAQMTAATDGGSIKIGEAKKLEVTEPVTVTLGVPQGLTGAVYVRHEKSDGSARWYVSAVREGAVTFENPHGFSRFSVTNRAPKTVARVGNTLYASLREAAEDVRDGGAVVVTGDCGQAIIDREVSFAVVNPGNFEVKLLPAAGFSVRKDGNIYTFTRLGQGGVTVWPSAGGTALPDTKKAAPGRLVTVTASPEPGFITVGLSVHDQWGGEVDVFDGGLGSYYFLMPAEPVIVEPRFASTADFFADTPDGWYAQPIAYAVNRGLMSGVGQGCFAPNSTATRAQLVTILYRLEGEPEVAPCDFTDVPPNQWYTSAVSWAAENGIVDGYADGTFGPSRPVTREQLAKILYGYASHKGLDVSFSTNLSHFTDAPSVSPWAQAPLSWAVAATLLSGTSPTTLSPSSPTTRAQIATVLMRLCENIPRAE